jgi:1,4-dihydroxy-2-naphthoate octaprenyltransferase
MKNKIAEVYFSFLAIYLLSCLIVSVIVLGMLLVPIVMVTLLALVIREVTFGRRKTRKHTGTLNPELKITATTAWTPRGRKAA